MRTPFSLRVAAAFSAAALVVPSVTVPATVRPLTTRVVEGVAELDRKQYFSLADAGDNLGFMTDAQFERYIDELGVTFGRRVNLMHAGYKWEKSIVEDPDRPGHVDLEHLKNAPRAESLAREDQLRERFPGGLGLVGTENFLPDAWPPFMEVAFEDADKKQHQPFPLDTAPAAEGMIQYLKHRFDDWRRPTWYEGINEPFWWWNAYEVPRFYDFHRQAKAEAEKAGLDMEVGGPCFPTVQHFKDYYQDLAKGMGRFIDKTDAELDFYSFHPYDYMTWDEDAGDWVGRITGGLPIGGVIDSLLSYGLEHHDKPLKFVVSEHGGYVEGGQVGQDKLWELTREKFPDLKGWDLEMARRGMSDFIMVNSTIAHTLGFMDHPGSVVKSIPFILLETSAWKPDHYASLLVPKDHAVPVTEWVESGMVNFYKFFRGANGRRVDAWCDDPDVRFQAFADGRELYLLFHNQALEDQTLDLNLGELLTAENGVKLIEVRTHGRTENFTPYFTEEQVAGLDSITLKPYESKAIVVHATAPLLEEARIEETAYFADRGAVKIEGDAAEAFTVKIDGGVADATDATLRIAVGRPHGTDRDIAVKLNGESVTLPLEDAAGRLDGKNAYSNEYGSLKLARVPVELLRDENVVEVSFPDGKGGGVGAVVLRVGRLVE